MGKAAVSKARAAYERARSTSRPGKGKRFTALTKAIAARGGVRDPDAVAVKGR